MKLSPTTLRLKIFLGMTAVLVGFAVLVTAVIGSMVERFIELEMSSSMGRAHDAYGRFAEARRTKLTSEAREVAQDPGLLGPLLDPESEVASDVLGAMHEEVSAELLVLVDDRGKVVADGKGRAGKRSLADRPGLVDVLLGAEYFGVWGYDGSYYSVAATPVLAENRVVGLVAIGDPIDTRAARELAALTSKDVIFLHSEDPIAWSMIDPPPQEALRAWLAGRAEGFGSGLRHNTLMLDGVEQAATHVQLPGDDTILVICRPVDEVIQPFLRARNEILTVGAAMVLFALFVSRELSHRMGRPIQSLTAAANAMSGGDLTAKVEITTNDELAVLGHSFNAMARTMQSLVDSAKNEARSAARAAEAKVSFLATMSHEIRTPLNGVLGFSEELLHSELAPVQREHAELVHGSGQDLKSIIDSVLDYSQIESGRLHIELAPFRLHRSVRRVTDPLCRMAIEKELEMTVSIDADVPDVVVGSRVRFEKVLQVLVDNAVRFTDQGRVAVRLSLEAGSAKEALVRAAVRDTGIGISPEHLAQVFDPFTQVQRSSNRRFGGSGLGLAIARDLAEQMGGTCEVESEPGFGSTFWLTAPFELASDGTGTATSTDDHPATVPSASEAAPAAGPLPTAPSRDRIAWESPARAGKRVLVVEDNAVNRKMATMLLQKAGVEFEVATNGEEGVARFRKECFDLILMDCQMPVMDGFEATRRIRAAEAQDERPHTPIVALTANTMEGDRETCLAAGMDGFIGKPFTAETLILGLDRWFEPTEAGGAA